MHNTIKPITDVQGQEDHRNLDIDKVGIKGFAFRGNLKFGSDDLFVQGTADCYVFLDRSKKGTHMSRMTRSLTSMVDKKINSDYLFPLLRELYGSLETKNMNVIIKAAAIRPKQSPVSKYVGYEEFKIRFDFRVDEKSIFGDTTLSFIGTSLCPASKTNSKYGAHNQRSLVSIKFPFEEVGDIKKYLEVSEEQLSAIVYPIVKLDDEAYITQYAYENAKFVEDIVRDVASGLKKNNLKFSKVSCENFESIHTHNAYAEIIKDEQK